MDSRGLELTQCLNCPAGRSPILRGPGSWSAEVRPLFVAVRVARSIEATISFVISVANSKYDALMLIGSVTGSINKVGAGCSGFPIQGFVPGSN